MSESASIKLSIDPRDVNLGGLTVRRVLPSPRQRAVGPFVFFDHFGPADFPPGEGIEVRPHPHIGLATVTYLFEGEILHRDSLGIVQPIVPGAINLMTAGRGIVHSERTVGTQLEAASRAHGIQSWIALPLADEECEPSFDHYPADEIPEFEVEGVTVRLIMGGAYGRESPVKTFSPTVYFECRMAAGTELHLSDLAEELGVYLVSGTARVDGTPCEPHRMLILHSMTATSISADEDARVLVVGGTPVGERHVWWNFVSSSRARIEQAKDDWRAQRFDKIAGESEFIPLPD